MAIAADNKLAAFRAGKAVPLAVKTLAKNPFTSLSLRSVSTTENAKNVFPASAAAFPAQI